MKKIILGLIFLSTCKLCYAGEVAHVETLPSLRTKQYSMQPYDKIVVTSAFRTGSTLIYNILKFLFEDEKSFSHFHYGLDWKRSVLKTHSPQKTEIFQDKKILYIIPIRNPIEASISMYRTIGCPTNKAKKWCKETIEMQAYPLLYAEKKKEEGYDVVVIKFEDFQENLNYLLDFFESYFSIDVSDVDKDIIINGYSKENVKANIKVLKNFGKILPLSGFHGEHIAKEEFTPPKDILEGLQYHLQEFKPLFSKYGYSFN